MARSRLALAVLLCAACGAQARGPARGLDAATSVTLYRDRALVAQRVVVDVAPATPTTLQLEVAAGVRPEDVFVVDPGPIRISGLRVVSPHPQVPGAALRPTRIELVAAAPRAGRHVVRLGYLTEAITWDATYTLTTATRATAVLRGALAIRNATGVALAGARLSLVDAEHVRTGKLAQTRTPAVAGRELGIVDLGDGTTRLELLPATTRALRSVLVYDPIGTRLDRNLDYPVRDASLGIHPPASPQLTESVEIERDRITAGLPGGPVRLLERHADGSLAVLGEARMFDSATRVAETDLVDLRVAHGVTGSRERRELTIDDDHARIVEEFVLSIDNRRAQPIEVVLREHLYRHQTWHLAYYSSFVVAKQEGAQQISLRLAVPARTKSKVLYVVVYPWKKPQRYPSAI